MSSPDNGQLILDIYKHFRSEAGHVLGANNFVAVAARQHVPMRKVREGLDYAASMHWVEQAPNGIRLTQSGYEALSRS